MMGSWEGEKSELRLQSSAATARATEGALIHSDAPHHRMLSGTITNMTQLLVQYKYTCKTSSYNSRALISNYAQNSNLVHVIVFAFFGETGSYRIRCRLPPTAAASGKTPDAENDSEKFPILFMRGT